MSTRPAFQFYARDWLTCPELRRCSVAARGLWADLLALAHFGEPYGHLASKGRPYDVAEIARLTGCGKAETGRLLAELERNGVCSRADDGAIFSRRMVRDGTTATRRADGGELGAEHGKKGAPHGAKGGRPKTATGAPEGRKEPPFERPSEPPSSVSEKPPSNPPPASATAPSREPCPYPPVGRERLIEILAGLSGEGTAAELHDRAEAALRAAGLEVQREYVVPDRGDGRRGKIDLHVVEPAAWIELDGLTPREKSLRKLASVQGIRIVVLRCAPRNVAGGHQALDAVIGLGGTPDGELDREDADELRAWWCERFQAVTGQAYPWREREDGRAVAGVLELAGGDMALVRDVAERMLADPFWRRTGFDLTTLRANWTKLLAAQSGPAAPSPVPVVVSERPLWRQLGYASEAEYREADTLRAQPKPKLLELMHAKRNGVAAGAGGSA